MEEKKGITMKLVEDNKVENEVVEEKTPKKLSYQELENVAHQLSEQSSKLYAQLQEMNLVNMFKRLEFLFKVVESPSVFSEKFFKDCVEEIEEMMAIPSLEEEEETE